MTTAQKAPKTVNGVDVGTLGSTVDAIRGDPELGQSRFRVHNRWTGGNHNVSRVEGFFGAKQEQRHKKPFDLHADEPAILAGADEGANPVEHLLHSLASCLTTAMIAHAAVRGIQIGKVESEVEGEIDLNGYLGLDNRVPKGYTHIRAHFDVVANGADPQQLKRLAEYSPVYNTLRSAVPIDLEVDCVG